MTVLTWPVLSTAVVRSAAAAARQGWRGGELAAVPIVLEYQERRA